MTPLEAALDWVQRGFFPIPIPYRRKKPVIVGWPDLRLSASDLARYFDGAAQNIGVLLGDNKGSTDVDLDCAQAIACARVLLPETNLIFGRESKPASHWFFFCHPHACYRKFIDPINKATLVELRCQTSDGSTGLQTVVPPSVHPSGEVIRFEPGRNGSPAHVEGKTLERAVAKIATAALFARHWPKEGSRHDAFLALAGILCRAAWSRDAAIKFHSAIYRAIWDGAADLLACAAEVNSTFEKHGRGREITGYQTLSSLIDPTALSTALGWIGISSRTNPAQIMEWPEIIPIKARNVTALTARLFPGFLGDMVAAVSRATETPIELAGMLGLAVTAACVAKKVTVSPEPGYEEPANIYTAVGMESGNRKTAVLYRMAGPFIEWERAEGNRVLPERDRAISERKTLEAQIEDLRKRAARGDRAEAISEIAEIEATLPGIPALPRLWVQDVTPEQLAVLMAEQDERIALLSDEGGIFEVLAGRYSKGIPNLDVFLQAHSGASIRIDRGSRPPIRMHRPALTVAISPQPHVLQNLATQPSFRGRGLLARFLYALPPSPLGFRTLVPDPVPASVESAYGSGIHRLLRTTPPPDCDGTTGCWKLRFSPEAYAKWKEFQRHIETLMQEGGKLHYLKDWGSKLPGAAARLCAISHCVYIDPGESDIIDVNSTEQALNLTLALIDHALAVFDLMQRDPVSEDAQRILKWINKKDCTSFTIRQCFCDYQSHFKRVDAMRPAIHLLEEHGYIRQLLTPKANGRPSDMYVVNPKVAERAE